MQLGKSRIDEALAADGVWTTFIIKCLDGDAKQVRLLLALKDGNRNPAYRKAMQRALEPHDRILTLVASGKASRIPDEVAQAVNEAKDEVFRSSIVRNWEGITDDTGSPVPCTPEGVQQLFAEFPELLREVEAESEKVERYRVAVRDAKAGN